jgi:predicted regulator of Ras-like GTPase activity (Roadblock/LC7/MglB family)
MDALLRLNAVPGVVGSMACDAGGQVLAQAFPPAFDAAVLRDAATALADRGAALQAAVGAVRTLDFRYADARVVVRDAGGLRLLFLCTPTVNLQTLLMSVSGAARSLTQLAGAGPAAPAAAPAAPAPLPAPLPAPAPAAGQLFQLAQRIEAHILRSGRDRFTARGQIARKAGLALDLIDPETPDDPATLQRLRAAAAEVLGQPI